MFLFNQLKNWEGHHLVWHGLNGVLLLVKSLFLADQDLNIMTICWKSSVCFMSELGQHLPTIASKLPALSGDTQQEWWVKNPQSLCQPRTAPGPLWTLRGCRRMLAYITMNTDFYPLVMTNMNVTIQNSQNMSKLVKIICKGAIFHSCLQWSKGVRNKNLVCGTASAASKWVASHPLKPGCLAAIKLVKCFDGSVGYLIYSSFICYICLSSYQAINLSMYPSIQSHLV